MADRKLTASDLLAGLSDIRLPSEAAGGQIAEVLAAIGLGLLLAAALSLILPLITKRVRENRVPTVRERIENTRALPDNERMIALLHLLKENRPDVASRMAANIYSPGGMPDMADLDAELNKADG